MDAPEAQVQDPREPGRFYVPGTNRPAVFQLEWKQPRQPAGPRPKSPSYRVMARIEYVDDLGRWHRLPKDLDHNSTDFASIPFFLTWLVPKDGVHTPAAILHDTLIDGQVGIDYDTSDGAQIDERHADYLFREAMRNSGVGVVRRWIMWSAVTLKTLCVERRAPGSRSEARTRWDRVIPVGLAFAVAIALAFVMALDVPDLVNSEATFDDKPLLQWLSWFDVFGERPLVSELLRGVGAIVVCGAFCSSVIGLVTRSTRGLMAGAIGGVAVGFLGLPMVASVVGYAIYWIAEWVARPVSVWWTRRKMAARIPGHRGDGRTDV